MPTSTTQAEIPQAVRRLAENPAAYGPVPPGFERVERPEFCALLGPMPTMFLVQRLQLERDGVERVLAEVRALARDRSRARVTWWIGDSATPDDLEQRLLALGLVPAAMPIFEPTYSALALVQPPLGDAPRDVVARRVESFDEYGTATRITHEAFGHTDEQREEWERAAPVLWELEQQGISASYLAFAEGEPVGAATAVFAGAAVMLLGGATLPRARGRGCYRALVQARWDDGVRRGTPALVVQAGEMSAPILERLGFALVARLRVLLDEDWDAPDPSAA